MANRGKTMSNPLEETIRIEMELGHRALEAGDREASWDRLFNVLSRLSTSPQTQESDALLPRSTLELSDLGFVMGRGFGDLSMLLQNAFVLFQTDQEKKGVGCLFPLETFL